MALKIEDFTPEEIASMTPTSNTLTHTPFEFDSITAGDVGKSLMSGSAMLGESIAGAGEYVGIPGAAEGAGLARDASQFWRDSMSPAGKHAMSREFARTDEEAAWRNLDSMILQLAQITPMTAATMGPVGAAARAGAGAGKLAAIGAGTEGVMSAGLTQSQISDAINKMSDKDLSALAKHHDVPIGGDPKKLRQSVKDRAARLIVPAVGAVTGALGAVLAPIQGKLLVPKNLALYRKVEAKAGPKAAAQAVLAGGEASVKQWAKDVGKGTALEAIQEALQEGSEHIGGQVALNQPVTEGLGEAMAAGAVLGAGMGGPATAVRGVSLPPDMVAAIEEQKKTNVTAPTTPPAGGPAQGIPAQGDMFNDPSHQGPNPQAPMPAQEGRTQLPPAPLAEPAPATHIAPGQESMILPQGDETAHPLNTPPGTPPAGTPPTGGIEVVEGGPVSPAAEMAYKAQASGATWDPTAGPGAKGLWKFEGEGKKGQREIFKRDLQVVIDTAIEEAKLMAQDGKDVSELTALLKTVQKTKRTGAKEKAFLDVLPDVLARTEAGTSLKDADLGSNEDWKRAPAPTTGPVEPSQQKPTAPATKTEKAQLSPAENKLAKRLANRKARDAVKAATTVAPTKDTTEDVIDKAIAKGKAATTEKAQKAIKASKKKSATKKAAAKKKAPVKKVESVTSAVPKKSAKGTLSITKKPSTTRVKKKAGQKKPLKAEGGNGNKQLRAKIDKDGKDLPTPELHHKSTPASEAKKVISIIAGSAKAGLQDLVFATGLSKEQLHSIVTAQGLLAKKIAGKKVADADEATAETLFRAYKLARQKGTSSSQIEFVKKSDRQLVKDVKNKNQAGGVVGGEIASRAGASLQDAVDIAVAKGGKNAGKVVEEVFSAAVASEKALPLLQAVLTELKVSAKIIADISTAITDKHANIAGNKTQDIDLGSLVEGVVETLQANDNDVVVDQILAGEEIIDDPDTTPERINVKAELAKLEAEKNAKPEDDVIEYTDMIEDFDYGMDDTNVDPNDYDDIQDAQYSQLTEPPVSMPEQLTSTDYRGMINARTGLKTLIMKALEISPGDLISGRAMTKQLAGVMANNMHSMDPLRPLLRIIEATGIEDVIVVMESEKFADVLQKPDAAHTTSGFHSEAKQAIVLNETLMAAESANRFIDILVHEMVHAATTAALVADTPAASRMKQLYNFLDATHPELIGNYGMTDIYEFTAEAMSNPVFQKALSQIHMPSKAADGLISAWQSFVNAVRAALNIPADSASALEHVMAVAPNLIKSKTSIDLLRASNKLAGRDVSNTESENLPEMLKPQSGDGRTDAEITEDAVAKFVGGIESFIDGTQKVWEAYGHESSSESYDSFNESVLDMYKFSIKTRANIGTHSGRTFEEARANILKFLEKPLAENRQNLVKLRIQASTTKDSFEASVDTDRANLAAARVKALTALIENLEASANPFNDAMTDALLAKEDGPVTEHAAVFDTNVREIGSRVTSQSGGFANNVTSKLMKWRTLDMLVDSYKDLFAGSPDQPYRNLKQFRDNPLAALNELRRKKARDARKDETDAADADLRLRALESDEKDGPASLAKLGTLMNYSTIGKIHADRSWGDPSHEHLRDVKDPIDRASNEAMYDEAAAMYKDLPPKFKAEYKAQREFFKLQFKHLRSASIKNLAQLHGSTNPDNKPIKALVNDLIASTDKETVDAAFNKAFDAIAKDPAPSENDTKAYKELAKSRKRFSDDVKEMNRHSFTGGPYFPLKRYGRYKVGATLNNEKQFFREDNLAELHKVIDKLKAENPGISIGNITEYNQDDAEYSGQAAAMVMDKAIQLAPQDTAAADRARRLIRQAFAAASPANSIQKHLMNRKGITGASNDVRRNLAAYSQGTSWSISSLRYTRDIHTALNALHKSAGAGGKDSLRMSQVANEMTRRVESPPSQQGTFTHFGSQYAFLNFLMSPSYSIVNSTQVAMITFPRISEEYGIAAGFKAIADAYKITAPSVGSELYKTGFGLKALGKGFAQGSAVDNTIEQTTGDTRRMLEKLRDRNMLGGGFTMDLSKSARGVGDSKLSAAGNKFIEFGRTAPQMVEEMNRLVTALATFELSMEKYKDFDRAVTDAEQMIIKTHFDYTDLNKPRGFTSSNLARMLTLYKMHPLGVYSNMAHYVTGMYKGLGPDATPEEIANAKAAMKGFGMFLATHSVGAGLAGAVLLEPISLVLQAIGASLDDEDEMKVLFQNPDLLIREATYWATGSAVASEAMTYGPSRLLGFDLHSRIGAHRLMIQVSEGDTGTETFINSMVQTGIGPLFSVKDQAKNMAAHLAQGDSWASSMSYLVPKGVRDPVRAFLMGAEGMKDFRGNVIADADQFGGGQLLAKGLGLSTSTEQEVYSNRNRDRLRKKNLKTKSTRIRRQFLNATTNAERNAIRYEINKFNAGLTMDERAQRMSIGKLMKSKNTQKTRERNTRAGVYSKKPTGSYPYTTLDR